MRAKMKKISLFIVLLTFCLSAFPQKLKLGIDIEPQLAWLSSDTRNVITDNAKFGIKGGIVCDKYFSKNYALHGGILIGTEGGTIKFNDISSIHTEDSLVHLSANTKVEYKLQYLSIPLGLKLRTNQIGYFTYYVLAGFNNQIRLKAKANSNDNTLQNDLINKEIRFYNLGYYFGLGAEYALSQDTGLTFGLNYYQGFVDITTSGASVKSRSLSLSAGIMF
jgi:hypothetical protein